MVSPESNRYIGAVRKWTIGTPARWNAAPSVGGAAKNTSGLMISERPSRSAVSASCTWVTSVEFSLVNHHRTSGSSVATSLPFSPTAWRAACSRCTSSTTWSRRSLCSLTNADVPAPPNMCPAMSTNIRLCGRCSRGTFAQ